MSVGLHGHAVDQQRIGTLGYEEHLPLRVHRAPNGDAQGKVPALVGDDAEQLSGSPGRECKLHRRPPTERFEYNCSTNVSSILPI